MLPKSYRLSRKDLLRLRKLGNRFQTTCFFVVYSQNTLGHLRLSTEISLKVSKRSTYRNNLRRRIYLIAERSPLVSRSIDVLLIAKLGLGSFSPTSTEFKNAVDEFLKIILNKCS